MLTLGKVKEFDRFRGDGDVWSHSRSTVLSDEEFSAIERILEDMIMIERGLVSKDYEAAVMGKLGDTCNGKETVDALRVLAINLAPRKR